MTVAESPHRIKCRDKATTNSKAFRTPLAMGTTSTPPISERFNPNPRSSTSCPMLASLVPSAETYDWTPLADGTCGFTAATSAILKVLPHGGRFGSGCTSLVERRARSFPLPSEGHHEASIEKSCHVDIARRHIVRNPTAQ